MKIFLSEGESMMDAESLEFKLNTIKEDVS